MILFPVTVIIPAYNASAFLFDTVYSAIMARAEKVIIVNDGSTDSTLDIANEIQRTQSNVEVISQINAGESAAINSGLKRNKSKYVLFLSSDDLISESLLERACEALNRDHEATAAYPSWNIIDENGIEITQISDIDFSYERLIGQITCLPGPGSVIRSSALGFGRLETLRLLGDYEQWIRLAAMGHFVHINKIMASWRRHSSNVTHNSFGSQKSKELDLINKSVKATLSELHQLNFKNVYDNYLANWHRLKAIAEVRVPHSGKSIFHLYESLRRFIRPNNFQQKFPWTALEVLACIMPQFARAWINLSQRFQILGSNKSKFRVNRKA
jgi:glycosyltransferase involved in cell wall biosynthesis